MARNPLSPFRSGGLFGGNDPFLSLHRDMNRLFDEFSRSGLPSPRHRSGSAVADLIETNMNVSETANEYRIGVEIPGVKEEDIDVRLDDDVLTIRGEKKFEHAEGSEEENYYVVECSYGTFQRSLRLPTAVDANRVSASFENGVLTVTLPKSQRQERSQRIQIQGQRQPQQSRPESTSATANEKADAKQQGRQPERTKRTTGSSKI
jgi:HSP20 family protein